MDTIFIITLNFVLDILGCLTVPVPKNFLPFYAIIISSVLIYIYSHYYIYRFHHSFYLDYLPFNMELRYCQIVENYIVR